MSQGNKSKARVNSKEVARAPGEYVSRTQKPINKISKNALTFRAKGITALREYQESLKAAYGHVVNDEKQFELQREEVRDTIAAMNYSVRDAEKELKRRSSAK